MWITSHFPFPRPAPSKWPSPFPSPLFTVIVTIATNPLWFANVKDIKGLSTNMGQALSGFGSDEENEEGGGGCTARTGESKGDKRRSKRGVRGAFSGGERGEGDKGVCGKEMSGIYPLALIGT